MSKSIINQLQLKLSQIEQKKKELNSQEMFRYLCTPKFGGYRDEQEMNSLYAALGRKLNHFLMDLEDDFCGLDNQANCYFEIATALEVQVTGSIIEKIEGLS